MCRRPDKLELVVGQMFVQLAGSVRPIIGLSSLWSRGEQMCVQVNVAGVAVHSRFETIIWKIALVLAGERKSSPWEEVLRVCVFLCFQPQICFAQETSIHYHVKSTINRS